jgi:hypothetical protein
MHNTVIIRNKGTTRSKVTEVSMEGINSKGDQAAWGLWEQVLLAWVGDLLAEYCWQMPWTAVTAEMEGMAVGMAVEAGTSKANHVVPNLQGQSSFDRIKVHDGLEDVGDEGLWCNSAWNQRCQDV